MPTTIRKVGNSKGIILPKYISDLYGLNIGQAVNITIKDREEQQPAKIG